MHRASRREVSLAFSPTRRKTLSEGWCARVPVCTLFASVHVCECACVSACMCAYKCAPVCLHVFMPACVCGSVHVYLSARVWICEQVCVCVCVCVYACAFSMGRAICQEGIPTQSRTVGACSYSPSFDPTPRKLELCRACSQTLPAECWLRIVEVQVKAKPLNAAPGQPHSRAFLGQPPRSDLGRRAGLGRRQAGPGFPACPFNPAVRREHVSGAPGGTRAPPPRRQLYFEHCLWPAARRLGSAVCLASLLLILVLQRSPLPFIRPRLEVGTPPISPPPPQAHTHSTRSNSGVETQKTSSLGSARLVQDAGVISPSPSNSPVPLPPAPATREGTVPPTAPSPACAQCPTGSPQNLPILPSLSDCPRRYLFSLSFSFLLCERGAGGKRRRNSFPA